MKAIWISAASLMMFELACGSSAATRGRDAGQDSGEDLSSHPAPTDATTADTATDAGNGDDDNVDADGGFAWREVTPSPITRFEANGVVVGRELWVMGGFSAATLAVTRRVDLYDPFTDSWRPGPDLPGAETHIAVVAVGSDVIVVGGFSGNFSSSTRPPTTDAVWRWQASSAQWTAGPSLPAAGAAYAWALVGTQLHVAGGLAANGSSDSAAHRLWDVTGAGPWIDAAPLPFPRNHGGGAATGGLFYAIAGRRGWDEAGGDEPQVNAFDPVSGRWSDRAFIPIARSEIGASTLALSDGRLLVVGGSVAGVAPSADVFVYDPALDAWSTLPKLPAPRKGAVAAQIGRRIVVTTGSPTSIDPAATTWIGCCL